MQAHKRAPIQKSKSHAQRCIDEAKAMVGCCLFAPANQWATHKPHNERRNQRCRGAVACEKTSRQRVAKSSPSQRLHQGATEDAACHMQAAREKSESAGAINRLGGGSEASAYARCSTQSAAWAAKAEYLILPTVLVPGPRAPPIVAIALGPWPVLVPLLLCPTPAPRGAVADW